MYSVKQALGLISFKSIWDKFVADRYNLKHNKGGYVKAWYHLSSAGN
jgi:hypothetical protein